MKKTKGKNLFRILLLPTYLPFFATSQVQMVFEDKLRQMWLVEGDICWIPNYCSPELPYTYTYICFSLFLRTIFFLNEICSEVYICMNMKLFQYLYIFFEWVLERLYYLNAYNEINTNSEFTKLNLINPF